MEVSAEAKRIMVVALGKLYSSRTQRGGLRLHRSLLLTLVMKSARDMYHAAQATEENVASECAQGHSAAEATPDPAGARVELQSPAPGPIAQARTTTRDGSVGSSTEPRRVAITSSQDKENVCPPGPGQPTRKRRGKAAAEPDFLPCKKAKLEQGNGPQHIIVNSVLMDYVMCGSDLAPSPAPIPLQRAIAAC
ncbi:immediate early response gene 2 protein [Mugil cephalus]|uniref:immediate early response gene 2 protein n=1 Tax=Mugil cephalus TaxID=48193 RepID=UPI001FB762E8|nr:immediate early response gene 2 protein [Mugil cephalus]